MSWAFFLTAARMASTARVNDGAARAVCFRSRNRFAAAMAAVAAVRASPPRRATSTSSLACASNLSSSPARAKHAADRSRSWLRWGVPAPPAETSSPQVLAAFA